MRDHRGGPVEGDAERGRRLWAQLAGTPFHCETCGGLHPLAEHQACRSENVRRILAAYTPAPGRQP